MWVVGVYVTGERPQGRGGREILRRERALYVVGIGSPPKDFYGKIGRQLSSSSPLHFPSSFARYSI